MRHFHAPTLPPHLPPNEFDATVTEARKWFEAVTTSTRSKPGTFSEATTFYLAALRARKGERAVRDATGRIKFYTVV